jgi:hypothetical protein
VIGFRCPTNSDFLLGGLHIELRTLNTTALISLPTEAETESFRQILVKNSCLLKIHPLYLLVLIFQERYHGWSQWFTSQWRAISDEIEVATRMTSKKWLARNAKGLSRHQISTNILLERVHEVQAELSHAETVMKYAKRFGAIQQVEEARRELVLSTLKKEDYLRLARRMKCVVSRCAAIHDRLPELKDRLKAQINVVRTCFVSSRSMVR